MAETSSGLISVFERHRDDPDHREAIIVTVEAGCSLADVAGLDVQGTARGGTIVMGTATADAVRTLETRDGVVRVEHDAGDMRALD